MLKENSRFRITRLFWKRNLFDLISLVTILCLFMLHITRFTETSQLSDRDHVKEILRDEGLDTQIDLPEESKIEENSHELFPSQPLSPQIFSQEPSLEQAAPNQVCVVSRNPRQSSLFYHNLLQIYGSGKYEYHLSNFTGTNPELCKTQAFRVLLIPYVRCCTNREKTMKKVRQNINSFDVTIITGDEYCLYRDSLPHFRQYHNPKFLQLRKVVTKEKKVLRFPNYLPLGPRSEFKISTTKEVSLHPVSGREYLFNFVGSLSSPSRRLLNSSLFNFPETYLYSKMQEASLSNFVHSAEIWRRDITEENGYVLPDRYRRILFNSVFTLCPMGHNPEAYRIYEASEAGSIPILVYGDESYNKHRCKDSFAPFKQANAPFVWLNSWDELFLFLEKVVEDYQNGDTKKWQEKQQEVRKWYENYMKSVSIDFEEILEWRHQKRVRR
eukprot:maker-scaffold_3-snap-gene-4.38-mRNA-1 protein AED:0.31 eAED:0.31 QI:102/1/1/1/1/1/3/161/440